MYSLIYWCERSYKNTRIGIPVLNLLISSHIYLLFILISPEIFHHAKMTYWHLLTPCGHGIHLNSSGNSLNNSWHFHSWLPISYRILLCEGWADGAWFHICNTFSHHDDIIKWKHFPCNWPFVQGHSPHKSQWRRTLMFSLMFSLHLNKRLSKHRWFEMSSWCKLMYMKRTWNVCWFHWSFSGGLREQAKMLCSEELRYFLLVLTVQIKFATIYPHMIFVSQLCI